MLAFITGQRDTTMLEFIGPMAIIYLLLMGLARLFGGKQPKREIYIIREYEIDEDQEVPQQPEQPENQPQQKTPPNNVIPLNRKR